MAANLRGRNALAKGDGMSNETFNGTTHIGVVLDKSGSMGAVRDETIGGFNP